MLCDVVKVLRKFQFYPNGMAKNEIKCFYLKLRYIEKWFIVRLYSFVMIFFLWFRWAFRCKNNTHQMIHWDEIWSARQFNIPILFPFSISEVQLRATHITDYYSKYWLHFPFWKSIQNTEPSVFTCNFGHYWGRKCRQLIWS